MARLQTVQANIRARLVSDEDVELVLRVMIVGTIVFVTNLMATVLIVAV